MTHPGPPQGPPPPSDDPFAALLALAPLGVAQVDENGSIQEVNSALCAFLERDAESLAGTSFFDLAARTSDATTLRSVFAAQEGARDDRAMVSVFLDHADDDPVHARVTFLRVPPGTGEEPRRIVMVEDINDLHLLQERLRHQNVHDPLTALPNAASFNTRLEEAMFDRSAPTIALIYLDIDGFRVINDGLGARSGDQVLRLVAIKLHNAFTPAGGLVARLTGDGFGILLRGAIDTNTVIPLVEKVLDELNEPVYVDGAGVGISASVGIVLRTAGEGTAEDLVRAAEITLHRAKEAGKSKWMLYESELDSQDRQRYRLGAVMAGALENGEFELAYQPTVKLDGSGQVPVVNAVLRWNHPESGRLTSEDFLPLADTTGMTLQLGQWLIGEAVATSARWREATGGECPDICLRLPARLAIDDDLVQVVRDEIERHGLPMSALRLCADSTTLLDPRGEVLDSLAVLGDLGVKLVLAVSGIADLDPIQRHQLPVGFVVLNGPVVDSLLDQDTDTRHIEHLIESASQLGVRIGAEGVRTEEQARRLAALGVIAARGEFYLDAVSADDIQDLITVPEPDAEADAS